MSFITCIVPGCMIVQIQSTVVSPKQSIASKLPSVIQKPRKLANKEGTNNGQNLALKASTPCPFLIRRGRCLKGNRCDFKHPKPSKIPKNNIPCPFLQKRGYCLKMNRCDFSHKSWTPKNTSLKPHLDNYTHHNPFLSHHRVNPNPFKSPQSYYLDPGRIPTVPVPLMDIPVPAWLHQPTYTPHPRQPVY